MNIFQRMFTNPKVRRGTGVVMLIVLACIFIVLIGGAGWLVEFLGAVVFATAVVFAINLIFS